MFCPLCSKQAIGRLVSDSLQIKRLFDILCDQFDDIQTSFDLGLLERIQRMQREEAPQL